LEEIVVTLQIKIHFEGDKKVSIGVYDNSACRLMVEIYENLINKNCVGLSLKKARETVFNDYNGEILHWGAYTMYGDPFRSIF
jgi:hypothetical protein